jgi:putative DNA modification/repair radical SAM protein
LKTIPGASEELIFEAGLYADRLSINLEIPTEAGLKLLAPEKNHREMIHPIKYISNTILQTKEEKKIMKSAPKFAPAGQSTQMIIGAAKESDLQIVHAAQHFYTHYKMKRVYYSGYVPISNDLRLPAIGTEVPLVRENRLYQTDWLLRFYGFEANEIVNDTNPLLDLDIDPKLSWALRNMDKFPVDVNRAPYEMILRIPGVGVRSAKKIVSARKFEKLRLEHLQKLGIAINKAKYFISCHGYIQRYADQQSERIKHFILSSSSSKYVKAVSTQLNLF